jgi:hypothetical protein
MSERERARGGEQQRRGPPTHGQAAIA